jgi:curved DNA-binding protein CbpA
MPLHRAPLHRAEEITYYEELGVEQAASQQEIRDAFRALVRLLHPDQHTDGQLKDIAERQMRKLNRIYSVLSDPLRRRRYDDLLRLDEEPPPPIVFNAPAISSLQSLGARFGWIAAVVLTVVFLVWLASESASGPQVQAFDRPVPPPAPLLAPPSASSPGQARDVAEQLRFDLRIALAERDAAIRELTRLRGAAAKSDSPAAPAHRAEVAAEPAAASAVGGAPAASRVNVAANVTSPLAQPDKAADPNPARQFSGFWFYSPPAQGQHNRNRGLYPPEYIEATFTEQNGVLHGKYRSRYLIVDRAISPDVNFEFTGTPVGSTMACPWTGAGGAKGDLTVRITGENSARIDWTANVLGSVQGLASGTAFLTRKLD